MAYARIPDELFGDDQYTAATDECSAAGTLVLYGYSYAAREASDGFVPTRQLRRMLVDPDELERAIDALVAAGLWKRVNDGIVMLDYTHAKRNMTRGEWEAKREKNRVRQAEWRDEQRRRRAVAEEDSPDVPGEGESQRDTPVTDGVTNAERTPEVTPNGHRQSRGVSFTREHAQIQIQTPKGGGGGERATAGGPVIENARPAAWVPATAALSVAKFSRSEIEEAREEIESILADETRPIDWPKLGRQLSVARSTGVQTVPRPASALLFALGSAGVPLIGQRQRRRPGQRNPGPPEADPAPTDTLADHERAALLEAIIKDARQHIGDDAWDTWLSVVRIAALDGDDLWLAVPAHARGWTAHRLAPLLRACAERVLDRPIRSVRVNGREAVTA